MEAVTPQASGSVSPGRVLVVDDQKNMRATTAILLRSEGFLVEEAATGEEALRLISEQTFDVLITDLKMEPMDGLSLLPRALAITSRLQVIVMTAYGSIETAVEAMRRGAYDYVTKPFKDGELAHRVRRAFEHGQLLNTVNLLAEDFGQRHGLSALIGKSASMRDLTSRIAKVAASDATILIQGESGTGKELVARAIHALSRRANQPFIPVNCAAITETLLESELFGHAKGAFTGAVKARRGLFEEAHGGTLFIDEVTETALSFQSKLLRVLQEGEVRRVGENVSIRVDVRIVTATNRDIEAEVAERRFRQDLFYRLAVVPLQVPPLRERLEDVPLLATHFLAQANSRNRKTHRLSRSAIEHLQHYSFPGNVRELENLVQQAAALGEEEELGPHDFPLRATPTRKLAKPGVTGGPEGQRTLAVAVTEAELHSIQGALAETANDLNKAAEKLGISSTTLWRKMRRLGIKASADPSSQP